MGPTLGNSSTKLTVPKGFPQLLEGLALEVLRHQPKEIVKFASNHFAQLLEARNNTAANPKLAATVIQKHYRGYVERKNFIEQKKAAVMIQKNFQKFQLKRSQSAGEVIEEKSDNSKEAATTIQKHYRGYVERKKYTEQKQAAKVIQKNYHKYHLKRSQSAAKIQSHFRSYRDRKSKIDEEVLKRADALGLEASATKIQAAYRGYQTRKNLKAKPEHPNPGEIEKFLDDVEKAAIIIQKNYKGYITRKKMQDAV